jgi:hypothetical protein
MGSQRVHDLLVRSRAESPCSVRGSAPKYTKRFAKGESKNSPVDCFLRGNALQVKAFPAIHKIKRGDNYARILFDDNGIQPRRAGF